MAELKVELPAPVSGRLPVLDELKGLALTLVVLYHAGGALVWNNYLHGDLGVDMFVILSGLGLSLGARAEGAATFFTRRLSRLIRDYNYYVHARWLHEANPRALSLILGMAAGLVLTLLASIELRRLQSRLEPLWRGAPQTRPAARDV